MWWSGEGFHCSEAGSGGALPGSISFWDIYRKVGWLLWPAAAACSLLPASGCLLVTTACIGCLPMACACICPAQQRQHMQHTELNRMARGPSMG
jgi:hypothetical protein